jgi:hypothetical protein
MTSDERVVIVAVIQGLARSAEQREILIDLVCTRRVVFEAGGKSEVFKFWRRRRKHMLPQ